MTDEHMPDDPLLRAVAEQWAEIVQLADDAQRKRLRGLVDGTAEPDPTEALAALTDELLELLPPDHPVIRVMGTRVMYAGRETGPPEERLADALRWLRDQVLPGPAAPSDPGDLGDLDHPSDPGDLGDGPWWDDDRRGGTALDDPGHQGDEPGHPPDDPGHVPDDFDRQVEDRLLRLPSLSADDVQRNQVDPDDNGLIRLPRPDHVVQFPDFQFTPAGTPWLVVQEVNAVLDAASDPWGVTCWWVDPHARLMSSPADLLGQGRDDLLRQAASAVGEEY